MVIYLRHPQHGTKVAISEEEAEQDRKVGWEDFDPTVVKNALRKGRNDNRDRTD
jgi:hypothetical protein